MNRRIAQIAVVVSDLRRSTDFYSNVFGMDYVFGTSEFRGPQADRVQNMDKVASSIRWLIDDRDMFQLEIFKFEHPESRPLAEDHSLTDEGYNRIIIAVRSLEKTSMAAAAAGGSVVALLCDDQPGGATHALLKDPDGVFLELVEAPDTVPETRPAIIVGLGISTLNLSMTVEDMCAGFGFSPCEDQFQHANFWREEGRLERLQTLQLEDMYLVVSQYANCRPRPADYRLADIGVMNFAVYFPSAEDFDNCYRKTQQMGMKSNTEPLVVENNASVAYNNDRQGFSVEMIFMAPKLRGLYGFTPPRWRDRALNRLLNWKSQRAYRQYIGSN